MTHDRTLGATWHRLQDLGYAATSATSPDRIVSRFAHGGNRDSFLSLGDHPAAIMCHPTSANGCALEDAGERQVVALVLTAYLLGEPKQAKAVLAVLEKFELAGGPVRVDGFGNEIRPLQWNGAEPLFDGEYSARLTHDDDDATVLLRHAIMPGRFVQRTDEFSRTHVIAAEPVGTHVIELEGEWKNGALLSTPRSKLPELFKADVRRLIDEVERARWGARPAAVRDAAA